ncbi:RidA family protein [Steroidobacter sp. S1-65]|uniref:RidA family protein n=1 Tax=Steroidobacter gossypii TaxID=2805490 RepID=A0ABS1X5M7_9GAMM|nr:RidA family protein [Steroidobacter gossypii]MBM0108527.1 RidA family protein [Steroidobacter gossypii]
MTIQVLQPPGWPRPKGYSNGMLAEGRQVFVAGQVGWNERQEFPDSLAEQVRQSLQNIVTVLKEAGARPEHIVRLTWYITSRDEYHAELPQIGEAYREVLGRHFPTMAVVQVVALMEAKAKVEIEAIAVIG